MRALLIVGAGGFGREAAEAVAAVNDDKPAYELLGFLDDNPDAAGTEVDGIPVLGPISSVADHPGALVIVSTGHPGFYFSRRRIVERLRLPADRYATLIHPHASVGKLCDPIQWQAVDVNHSRGLLHVALHEVEQIGSAGEEPGIRIARERERVVHT